MQRNIALVNLDNVVRNAENIRSVIGSAKLCAVVKCDGYGHGAAAIANALHGVCDSFAVALVDEGAQIRAAGVDEDILVLQPALDETEVLRAAAYNMILTLADDNDFLLVKKTCEKFGVRVRVHLKANTGMNRLGYEYWQFLNSCLLVKKQTDISVEGVYSHFYLPESRSETRAQYELVPALLQRGGRGVRKTYQTHCGERRRICRRRLSYGHGALRHRIIRLSAARHQIG